MVLSELSFVASNINGSPGEQWRSKGCHARLWPPSECADYQTGVLALAAKALTELEPHHRKPAVHA